MRSHGQILRLEEKTLGEVVPEIAGYVAALKETGREYMLAGLLFHPT
jgi:hypothetical protein